MTVAPRDEYLHTPRQLRGYRRTVNKAAFKKEKKNNAASVLTQNIMKADKMLGEVRTIEKSLRPLLTNGAINLGQKWDKLLADQIHTAMTGTVRRAEVDFKTGKVVLQKNGRPVMGYFPVEPRDQLRVRKELIELFPKLIPEEARATGKDPLVVLGEIMAAGYSADLAIVAKINPEKEQVAIAVEGILSDNGNAIVDLSVTAKNA